MKNIPCRKCDNCGLYHDFTVSACPCGNDILNAKVELIDYDKLDIREQSEGVQLIGKINDDLQFYVQICPDCGAKYFFDSPTMKIEKCSQPNCKRSSIADYSPELYIQPVETVCNKTDFERIEKKTCANDVRESNENGLNTGNDDEFLKKEEFWIRLHGKTDSIISENNANKNSEDENMENSSDLIDYKADKGEWSFIEDERGSLLSDKKNLLMTSVTYGKYSFALTASEEKKYLLGRSAEQSEFLSQDLRVGNEHCYLYFKSNTWYIEDNCSRNGTFVNGEDIGQNGIKILENGDIVKLGHNIDSMAFRVSFLK